MILHIGAPKTGTTALQVFFSSNADLYETAGLLYPVTGRKFQRHLSARHHGFALAMSGPQGTANALMMRHGLSNEAARIAYVTSFRKQFDRELAKKRPDTVLISNEDLFLLRDRPTIEAFSGFLKERFDKVRVICHLRNPIDYVRGRYSTAAKAGRLTSVDFKADKRFKDGIFLPQLNSWSEFFERSELEVSLARPDSIARLHEQLGMDELGIRPETGANRSLTTQGLELMIALNRRYRDGDFPKILRSAFETTMTGDPFELQPEIVSDIWSKFDAERASLLENYLSDRDDIRMVTEEWHDTQVERPEDARRYDVNDSVIDLIANLADRRRRAGRRFRKRKRVTEMLKRRIPAPVRRALKRAIGRKDDADDVTSQKTQNSHLDAAGRDDGL